MTDHLVNRRMVLGAGAGLAVSTLFGGPSQADDTRRIRAFWWGSQERADRSNKAVDAFKTANAGIDVKTESAGWNDYWPRLATQVAGQNAPDLIQMDYRYLFEYARRGAIIPLDDYLGKGLDIADFGKPNLDSCRVDGKLYGINLGVNSSAIAYDARAWQDAGAEPPALGASWEEFAAKCAAFAKGNKRRNFYAACDASGVEPAYELWLRQRGKALYDADGKLAFDATDAADWFKMWGALRDAGSCVTADIQALDKLTLDTSPLALGKAALSFLHANQFIGAQALSKSKLSLTAYPVTTGGKPGHYYKPSMMWSIATSSKAPEAAIKLANFTVKEQDGVKAFGVERGVPASPAIRDLLAPLLDDTSKQMVDYVGKLDPYVGPLPPSPPKGAGEVAFVLRRLSQEVAFGSTTPEDGGAQLVTEANSILKRG